MTAELREEGVTVGALPPRLTSFRGCAQAVGSYTVRPAVGTRCATIKAIVGP